MSPKSSTVDAETLLATAEVLAEAIPVNHLTGVRDTLEYLHHTSQEIDPPLLQKMAPCDLSTEQAENIVFQLSVEGILDGTQLKREELRDVFIGAEVVATQKTPPENTIVATIPYDDSALDQNMFEPLHGNILSLIRSASNHLTLMSPFLSKRAYERLRPALHTAVDNGATISLITNSLTYGKTDYNQNCVNAILSDNRLSDATQVYEYINQETWTTFHAKIVIADAEQAYLGTANLTHTGLGDNLELGVRFRDSTATRLSNLVTALKQSEFLHSVEEHNNKFIRT